MRSEELGGIVRIVVTCGAGFEFSVWERFAGIRETHGRSAGEWGGLRGLLQIQTDEPEHGANLARSATCS